MLILQKCNLFQNCIIITFFISSNWSAYFQNNYLHSKPFHTINLICRYLVKPGSIYSCSQGKAKSFYYAFFKQTYILCEVTELTCDDAFPEGMKYWQISKKKIVSQ